MTYKHSITQCESFEHEPRPATGIVCLPDGWPRPVCGSCLLLHQLFQGAELHPIERPAALQAIAAAADVIEAMAP